MLVATGGGEVPVRTAVAVDFRDAASGRSPINRSSGELRRPLDDQALATHRRAPCLRRRLLLFAYIAAGVNNELDDKGFQAFLAAAFYTLLMLLTCVIAATSIAQEKEGETWTVLLASPLSGWAIVWGKALGVARRLMWPMVLVVRALRWSSP